MLNNKLNRSHFDNPNIDLYDFSDYDYLTSKIIDKDYGFQTTQYNNPTGEGCYATSNEHLDSYMSRMHLKNKRVATVGSSGDQALNALFYGSKDVTLIDGNPYTRAFVEYKMALIKNLGYREFWKLLDKQFTTKLFSWETYARISHDLSEEARYFWDKIMLEQSEGHNGSYNPDDLQPVNIYYRLCNDYPFKSSSFYKYPLAYKKLQRILREGDFNLEFKNADVYDFNSALKGRYDAILLSNIMEYTDYHKYTQFLQRLRDLKLNPNGIIQYNYTYRFGPHERFCLLTSPRIKQKAKIKYCNGHYAYFLTKKQNSKEKEMGR